MAIHVTLPVVDVGTAAEPCARAKKSGRYTIIAADDQQFLYVPEIQAIFQLDADSANALRDGLQYPDSGVAQRASQLVELLVADHRSDTLRSDRHATRGLRDVVVHVAQLCNLDCVYCYAHELNAVNKIMSREVAEQVIQRTMKLATERLSSVKFLGGEPTLAWPIVEYVASRYREESIACGVEPPHFTLVTNGTKWTPAMADFAARVGMHVLVSIDGPRELHDALRPTLSGAGSFDRAVKTIGLLKQFGVDVAAEATYTRQHFLTGVTPQMIMEQLLSLGIREVQIAPAVGIWHDSDTISDIREVTELFESAARTSVRSFRTNNPYLLRGIQFVLDGFALREARPHVCGAGRTFMGVNYDGEAFPCYLLQSSATSYGFIDNRWNEERYENVRTTFECNGKAFHPVCRTCWANEICQSCLGTSFQISPEVSKPPAWFCAFQKTLIGAVLAEIASALSSNQRDVFICNLERHLQPLLNGQQHSLFD